MWPLYIGSKATGITVKPDDKYPSMFRIHWADRPPSDMVNLSRAKEAAMRWAAREHRSVTHSSLDLNWKVGKSH